MVIRHPTNLKSLTRIAAIVAAVIALTAERVDAVPFYPDWLTRQTGERLQGEIVRADRFSVDFRMLDSGRWVTKTFRETDIVRRERVDGIQSDGASNPEETNATSRPIEPTKPPPSATSGDASKPTTASVASTRRPALLDSPKDLISLLRNTLPPAKES